MLTASDGLIYIGGNLGTDCFNPNDVKQNGYHPSVVLEDIKIQNRSVTPGGKHAPIGKSIAYERKITLNHWQNSFSIDYAGIDYNYSDKLRYAYKLDGLDKDWVEGETTSGPLMRTFRRESTGSNSKCRTGTGNGVRKPGSISG